MHCQHRVRDRSRRSADPRPDPSSHATTPSVSSPTRCVSRSSRRRTACTTPRAACSGCRLAFGVSSSMLVALTLFVATLIGRLANGPHVDRRARHRRHRARAGRVLLKRGLSSLRRRRRTRSRRRAARSPTPRTGSRHRSAPDRWRGERLPPWLRSPRTVRSLLAFLLLLLPLRAGAQGTAARTLHRNRRAPRRRRRAPRRRPRRRRVGRRERRATPSSSPPSCGAAPIRPRSRAPSIASECISTSSSAARLRRSRRPIRHRDHATLAPLATRSTRINAAAFGFRAHRSRDIAVETSRTFAVVSRFHRAIGVITIVASAIFLLCIMLLKVDERRRDVAALRLMGISARSIVRIGHDRGGARRGARQPRGVGIGWAASRIVNWHYQARVPHAAALLDRDAPTSSLLAVSLSLVLGIGAGLLAARRLVRTPPLALFGR